MREESLERSVMEANWKEFIILCIIGGCLFVIANLLGDISLNIKEQTRMQAMRYNNGCAGSVSP